MIHEPQIGDRVKFAAVDVFLPGEKIDWTTSDEGLELDGRIVEFSDSGTRKRAYAVVAVVRTQMMVVPVERLTKVEPSAE